MKRFKLIPNLLIIIVLILISNPGLSQSGALKTPLPQETLDLLTNEISGQMIYNNLVSVAGAPWIRGEDEFTDTFYETNRMYELVKSYGIDNVKLERSESDRDFEYPVEGEFWIEAPDRKLIARLGADAALVARGSQNVDFSADLIYIGPLDKDEISEMLLPANREKYQGKVALMWSHARGELAEVLDSVGVRAVVSFSSRERYVDPNMVVYSSGSYSNGKNLQAGFTLSWRQWSELLEDIEFGVPLKVKCKTRIEKKHDKFEAIFAWIQGTEPDKPGVFFTAHLFEGYTKRGANDNAGGCVVQLEILRALTKLIEEGSIDQPRRNIYFLWPNEISGTYKFISENPDIIQNSCININMDMVTEGLRLNNSWLTMSETPDHLASFFDGLANSVLNYVWRTNDIVYLNDSPRGRRGGQYFPKPMLEKNGSVDAFRYFSHEATGGSDHLCFNGSSVAVPGIEFFTWPDYWYHADTDTPDKGDPTQMKRIAFIGAATAFATANCSDANLPGMIDVTSDYGYKRFAERALSRAITLINNSSSENLQKNFQMSKNIVAIGVDRELNSLISIKDIYTNSPEARVDLDRSIVQWKEYKTLMGAYIKKAAEEKAKALKMSLAGEMKISTSQKKMQKIVPSIHQDVMYKFFSTGSFPAYQEQIPALRETAAGRIALSRESRALVNYIDGNRTLSDIVKHVEVLNGKKVDSEEVIAYFEMLKEIGYIKY